MKNIFIYNILFDLFNLIFLFEIKFPFTEYNSITPKKGYISAYQTLSIKECFNPKEVKKKDIEYGYKNFLYPINYKTLIKEFGYSTINKRYQHILESDMLMKYFNQVQENDYSISFNYINYHVYSDLFIYDFENELNILNSFGKEIYKNNLNHFKFICGDKLFKSYNYGITLIITIKINFDTPFKKYNFLQYVKKNRIKYKRFEDLIQQIDKIYMSSINNQFNYNYNSNKNVNYLLEIYGIQLGGNGEYINQYNNNNFKINYCNQENIKNCINLALNIKTYYDNDYENQIKENLNFIVFGAVHKYDFRFSFLEELSEDDYFKYEMKKDMNKFLNKISEQKKLFKILNNKFLDFNSNSLIFSNNKVEKYYKNLEKNINYLFSDFLALNCFRNYEKFSFCHQEILNNLSIKEEDLKEIESKILLENSHLSISLDNNFCLPKNFASWTKKNSIIKIKFIYDFNINKYIKYIDTIYTKNICYTKNENNFYCTDEFLFFDFNLLSKNNKYEITCFNNEFNFTETKEIELFQNE